MTTDEQRPLALERLIGTWHLQSCEGRSADGQVIYPYIDMAEKALRAKEWIMYTRIRTIPVKPDGLRGERTMNTFVLVHGAWHGGWCWHKVKSLLEKQGHNVITPDLPGHGKDQTRLAEVTLQSFVERVIEIIDAQPEPVILVGHSMGGMVITQAAEVRPDRIQRLVYLTAYLPRNGESLIQLAQRDTEAIILPNLIVNEQEGWVAPKEGAIRALFYHDCSDEDFANAQARMNPKETLAASRTPVQISDEKFGRVPRSYIRCLNDRAIGPLLQKQMAIAAPCQLVLLLNTSHSPFFAAPEKLVNHLLAAAVVARPEPLGV
jgi:pimeloyl-ACP methyl ester carboxylesterase